MKAKSLYKMIIVYVLLMMTMSFLTPELVSPGILFALFYVGFWTGRMSKDYGWHDMLFEVEIEERKPEWGSRIKPGN